EALVAYSERAERAQRYAVRGVVERDLVALDVVEVPDEVRVVGTLHYAGTPEDEVVAPQPANQGVMAKAAVHRVVAIAAVERVRACEPLQKVVTAPPVQEVRTGAAGDRIALVAALDVLDP